MKTTKLLPTGLGQVCVDTALRSALAYLKTHNLEADDEPLFSCVKAWCKIKLPEAITDYRAACNAGMNQWADKTFLASMALAGIEAAKEASKPPC